jgi:hypothetical protein
MTLAIDPSTGTGYFTVWAPQAGASASTSRHPSEAIRISGGVEQPPWLEQVASSLKAILSLEQDWDSYGAPVIEPMHVVAALQLLRKVAGHESPPPWTVPTARRGVQFEWHLDGVDIELAVDDDGALVYLDDEDGEAGGEVEQRPDLVRQIARHLIPSTATTLA